MRKTALSRLEQRVAEVFGGAAAISVDAHECGGDEIGDVVRGFVARVWDELGGEAMTGSLCRTRTEAIRTLHAKLRPS